jgi:UDP-glucose:(heptosyl)LPS alpha-1,3-glucosyltransferase
LHHSADNWSFADLKTVALIRRAYRLDGGAEVAFQNYINCYVELGYDVTILCERWDGEIGSDITIRNFSGFGTRSMRYILFVYQVQKHLLKNHYDIIQSHEWIPIATIVRLGDGLHSFWFEQLLRNRGVVHSILTRLSLFHWIKSYYESQTLNSPTLKQIIVNSNYIVEQIAEKYPAVLHKTSVQRNVIPTTFFESSPTAVLLRNYKNKVSSKSDSFLKLVFVGSGWSRKGLAKLLEALAYVERDWSLVVVGADKRAHLYVDKAEYLGLTDKVTFLGVRKIDCDFYRSFDALVLPTSYDPFPNVIAEALSSGVKVVTSSLCGGKDFQSTGDVIIVDSQRDLVSVLEHFDVELEESATRAAKYQEVFSHPRLITSMKGLLND